MSPSRQSPGQQRRVRAALATLIVLATAGAAACGAGSPAGSADAGGRASTAVLNSATPAASATGPSTVTPSPPTSTQPSPTTSPTPIGSPTPPQVPVVVIDPGHSGTSIRTTTVNGLRDIDYPNYPEIYETFDVSVCVARALRADGYRALLTKRHALSSVSHTQRAAVANDSRAALAISVHDDHGVGPTFEATYDQRGVQQDGAYHPMYRGVGSHRTVYALSRTARQSQRYARILAAARTQAQGRTVHVAENSFTGRPPLEPGNLALVQLLSKRPWVYNEMGALTAGDPARAMSIASERRYALGLLTGVETAVPLVPGQVNPATTSASTLTACLVQRVEPTPGTFTRPQRYLPYGFG